MSETSNEESFSKLPEGSKGERQDEKIYFEYSASLRIFGIIADLDGITHRLGVMPTHTHRQGDRRGPTSTPYKHDMWSYTAPVKNTESLHVHIDALWNTLREHRQFLLQLKHPLTVDAFLTYSSNCDHAGVEIPYQSLEMFRELQIPFGLSIIVV